MINAWHREGFPGSNQRFFAKHWTSGSLRIWKRTFILHDNASRRTRRQSDHRIQGRTLRMGYWGWECFPNIAQPTVQTSYRRSTIFQTKRHQSNHWSYVSKVLFPWSTIFWFATLSGCGKTSLLMALLGEYSCFQTANVTWPVRKGEMHLIPSNGNSWFNLPRGGGIAYSAQESWVQNATIRENIIFGSPYDEKRYQQGDIHNSLDFLCGWSNKYVQSSTSVRWNVIWNYLMQATRRKLVKGV